jgi:hypothetical protein
VFSVPGRQAQQHFIEFGVNRKDPLPGVDLKAHAYSVAVEVLVGHRRAWRRLVSFPLQAKKFEKSAPYIAYSNDALGD